MPKPVLGSQTLQDTFESIKQQGSDVVSGLKDLVAGGSQSTDTKGDSGIEQLAGQQDPKQQAAAAQQSGLTPQQLAENRAEEQRQIEYHQGYIKKIDEDQAKLRQEAKSKADEEARLEQERKQQEIIQLREEQAKAATLQGQAKPKQGRGTAFLPPSAKQSMGTGELAKTPTN